MAAASSATPVNWVQSVNLTITGHTPGDLSPNGSKLNNKGLLEDLNGATVTNFVGGGSTTTSTTNSMIDVVSGVSEIDVTNYGTLALSTNNFVLTSTNGTAIFGTNGALIFSNFPSSLTATGVTFLTQSGTNVATNMSVTLTLDTNAAVPTYTFANSTTVTTTNSTNTGYAFTNSFAITNATGTNLPATYISAVVQTNSTTNALFFSLETSYLTNIVTTTTSTGSNVVTGPLTVPKGASLVLVTPIPPGTNAPYLATTPPVFAMKSGTGKNEVLTVLSAFVSFVPGGTNQPVATIGTSGISYGLVGIVINFNSDTLAGRAFYKETDKSNKKLGDTLPTSISAAAIGYGSVAGSAVNNLVFDGTISATGGTATAVPLTEP